MFAQQMKTKVVKIDEQKPDIAKIKEAAAVIDAGGLVAFPTETVYGIACRVNSDSLAKLNEIKCRDSNKHYTLHISQKSYVRKYVPSVSLKAQKLIDNAWPGPVTIVFELNEHDLAQQHKILKRNIFENLYSSSSIGIRCPENAIASILLRLTHNPIVAPSANLAGENPSVEPKQVLSQFSGKIEILLDSGASRYRKSSTIVKIEKGVLKILRAGVYSQEDIERMAEVNFLFVCSGNTCRSPMAEGIFRKYLAEKLQYKVDRLGELGYKVSSAGILDMDGYPASAEAITACAAKGIDISIHRSKKLSVQLLKESDYIFAMAHSHCEHVVNMWPDAQKRCIILAENEDIVDPIGQSQEFFNNCANLIEKAVKERISGLVI
jgi:L-threonylcarbamoyladenylate synthase